MLELAGGYGANSEYDSAREKEVIVGVYRLSMIASNNLPKLKALFRLYNLDEYIIDICAHASKERAVFEYIDANRDWIHRYVVIDDSSLMSVYGYSFVQPNDVMNMENYEQCVSILNNAYSFERKEEAINVFKQERCVLKVSYKPAVMQGKKLLLRDITGRQH